MVEAHIQANFWKIIIKVFLRFGGPGHFSLNVYCGILLIILPCDTSLHFLFLFCVIAGSGLNRWFAAGRVCCVLKLSHTYTECVCLTCLPLVSVLSLLSERAPQSWYTLIMVENI